jgi:hypothetical protein
MKRTAALVSVGVIATALAIGSPLAASAAGLPVIALSAPQATVNGSITVTADGFAPNEELTFSFESDVQDHQTTDGAGHVVGSVFVPAGTVLGPHAVTVTGSGTESATLPLEVVAAPTTALSASTVTFSQLDSGITATVKGFMPGDTVQFGFGTGASGGAFGDPVTVGADGTAKITVTAQALFNAPVTTASTITISASNAAGNMSATAATLNIVADQAAPTPATPAVPVKANASFTG